MTREALQSLVAKHAAKMPSSTGLSLLITLFSGITFTVQRIAELDDQFAVLCVFPQNPLTKEDVEALPRGPDKQPIFDRVVLAYQDIAYVTITAREPEVRSTVGFQDR